MGNLTKIPHSELHATLEILEHLGVEERHCALIRKDPARASMVAQTMIGGYVMVESKPIFKVWRTLKLGTGLKTADDFRKALKQSGNKVSSYANDLLEKIKAATEETEVDLCRLTVAELTGKEEIATTIEVFAGADRLGFEKCTPEVGPQLRIQYPDQPMNERLFIGMDLITGRGGGPDVFRLGRSGGGLWLSAGWAFPRGEWNPEDELVFRLRKFSKES